MEEKKQHDTNARKESLLKSAVQYAERGWLVFPCHSITNGKCTCGKNPCNNPGKHPRTKNGLTDASTDLQAVAKWWSQWPDANVAIRTGAKSGLAVLDIDVKGGGPDNLELLEAKNAIIPDTLIAQTGGGGKHYFFKYPKSEFKNSVNEIHSGIDTRGEGGYVIATPSNHISGKNYAWQDDEPGEVELANFPKWLIGLMDQDRQTAKMTNTHLSRRIIMKKSLADEKKIVEGSRNDTLIRLAGSLRAKGMDTDEIITFLLARNREICDPPLPKVEIKHMARSIESWEKGGRLEPSFDNTDAGNATNFAQMFQDDLIYVEGLEWHEWTGKFWRKITNKISEYAIQATDRLMYQADKVAGEKEKKNAHKWSITSRSFQRLDAAIKLARPKLEIPLDRLDASKFLLNAKNGMIDLQTGKLLEHNPQGYLTKMINADYEPNATSKLWVRFIDEITCGDEDLANYLQRVVGYCLTGSNEEQCFFILLGDGLNGKSTFLDVLRMLFAGYAATCAADTFLENGRDPSQEMARLSGVRMALASEVSNRGQLNTTLAKAVTGDASIPARKLYKDTFEYDPQFKIMIACNDTPSVPCNDFAVWRRLKLIPFNLRVENVDKSLSRKLLAESAGILAWAVKGCLAWQKLGGLGNSLAIEDATSKCKARSDKLQQFLNECIEKDEKKFITSAALFAEFNQWISQTSITPRPITTIRLAKDMRMRGYSSETRRLEGKVVKGYHGLGLIPQKTLNL